MITVAPNPILFQIGPLAIRFYGLVYALGFMFTYWYLRQLSKHKQLKLSVEEIETFLIYEILGTIIGGRLGEFIFYQTDILLNNPIQILKIWQGGMSFHGAIIGIIIATTIFCKKYKVDFYTLTDHLVIPGTIGLFFGRIANFINAELIGRITNVAWCVNWFGEKTTQGELVCRHPSQIYEATKNLFMLIIFFFMQYDIKGNKKNKKYKSGYLTWLFIFMYGTLRATVTIWREDTTWFLGIMSTGQVLSSIMAIIAIIILYTQYWKKIKNSSKPNKKK